MWTGGQKFFVFYPKTTVVHTGLLWSWILIMNNNNMGQANCRQDLQTAASYWWLWWLWVYRLMPFPQQNPVNRPVKTRMYCSKWSIAELTVSWRNISVREREECLLGESTPSAVTNVWEHSCATSQTLLSLGEQFKHVGGRRREAGKRHRQTNQTKTQTKMHKTHYSLQKHCFQRIYLHPVLQFLYARSFNDRLRPMWEKREKTLCLLRVRKCNVNQEKTKKLKKQKQISN